MAQTLDARFQIKDDGSVVLRNISKELYKVKSNTKDASKAADAFGDTSVGATKRARKGHEELNDTLAGTERAYKKLGEHQGDAGGWKSDSSGVRSLIGDAASFAAVGIAARKAWKGTMDAINLSAMQKVQETTFQALLNSKAAGSALYDYVSAYAKVSVLGREDLANAVTAYSAYTKNADQLERMMKLTERLYAKDPTQGAEGAVFAMRELLSGDTMSIKDRFNMSGFSGEMIRNFANTGDIEGMLDYVDQMFNRFGATQEVVDANFDNLTTQTNIFTSNLKTAIAESATPAMETLAGTMRRLNAEMDAGKHQPFIALMANGMELIGSGIAWVAENLNWLAPAVLGGATAFIVYKGVQMTATAAMAIFKAVTALTTLDVVNLTAAVAGLVGGMAAMSAVSKQIDAGVEMDMESAKKQFADLSANLPAAGAKLPVEVANSAPIKVKGEVEIEEESMRYLLDIQGQKWLAKFSTATLAPQMIFNGTTIEKTADFDEFAEFALESLRTSVETAADGVY